MRGFLLAALVVTACSSKSSSTSNAPASVRFLPASPELAFRIDMTRVRAWPGYAEAAPIALTSVEMLAASAKEKCGLDVLGTATTITAAKTGPLMSGDVALIVDGLPRDKVASCLTTIAAAKSLLALTIDGELFHASVADRAIASGAILPSGEVILVSRKGAGVDPAAWKAEVASTTIAIPAWWTELSPYVTEPVAVRAADDLRVVFATATLTDGLALGAKVINKTADGAKRDAKTLSAMLDYLQNAKAGTGKVEAVDATTTTVALTAKGESLTTLIKTGGPALFTRGVDLAAKAAAGPVSCDALTAAVTSYMEQALATTPEERKAEMAQVVTRMLPELQTTYVAQCKATTWEADAISCHVDNAKNLPRFEKCRLLLTPAQQGPFDTAVAAVLAKEMPAAK